MSLPSSPEPDLQKEPHPESEGLCKSKVSPVKWLHPSFTETPVKWLYPESGPGSDTSFEMTDETNKQAVKGNEPTVEDKKQADEKSTTDDDEIDVGEEIQNISKEVTAAASYLGSMFSSAVSRTATVASEATSNVRASGFFSAIGGPIKPDDDDAQPMRAEDVKEVEEVPPLPESSSITFFTNAWSKVGSLAMPTSWAGGDAAKQVKEEGGEAQSSGQPGNLLDNFSSVMTSATSALQQTVVKPSHMISEFNREQEKFLKEKAKESDEAGAAPWVGYRDEDAMKRKILSLSEDKRTFVRPPPAGVSFDFDYNSVAATALVLLKEDKNLPKMRYELVPKAVKEVDFWRNYFYRVSLIKQSFELKEFEEKSSEIPTRQETFENRLAPPEEDLSNHSQGAEDEEFISDTYQASADDMAEVDASMKTLGVGKKGGRVGGGSNDEEWEAELEGELNEFEVVSSKDSSEESPQWESQIQEMLDAEEK